MKNLLFLLSFLLTTTFVSAQMTTWTWDLYKVQFQAPSNFKVSKNDKSGFSAGNGHINLTIYPENGKNHSLDQMAGSLESWANREKAVPCKQTYSLMEFDSTFADILR